MLLLSPFYCKYNAIAIVEVQKYQLIRKQPIAEIWQHPKLRRTAVKNKKLIGKSAKDRKHHLRIRPKKKFHWSILIHLYLPQALSYYLIP